MRLLLLLLLMTQPVLPHAEDEAGTGEADKTGQEEPRKEEAPEKEKKAKIVTPDSFDPTEKLSEDIAVDFPVDI